MDVIDSANERAEQFTQHSIANAVKVKALPDPTGLCFNCAAPVAMHDRWCDCDCRNDWELRVKRSK